MNAPVSEAIEHAALEDLHRAVTAEIAARSGIRSLAMGGALVSMASALPETAIVLNRTIGLGIREPASDEVLDAVVSAYRDTGVARYFVQLHPDARPIDLEDRLLGDFGLVRARGWQKFSRGRESVPGRTTELDVREIGPEHGSDFGAIVASAFDLGEAAAPWLACLAGREGWHLFMSFEGDEPAGTGAMFVNGDAAWLDYGATRLEFRRRGSQGAVLAARLELALELGCRAMFTCTGVAAAGDPQHSYGNILKMGFRTEYVRENLAPAPNES